MNARLRELAPDLFVFEDTCQVYVLRQGRAAVLIDCGSGAVLEALPALGIDHVTDVLLTHHHRDQAQGLPALVAAGARGWAPHAEQDLVARVDAHWQAREIYNNYNTRQDRFSPLEPVPLAGTLRDYARYDFGGQGFTVLPTPGHTPGSITLWAERAGEALAFTGDLIAGPGQVWSLAATQWTYNGAQGVAASIAALLDLKQRGPARLLPAHGAPMGAPGTAIDLLVERLVELLRWRRQNPRLLQFIEQPYAALTPHLLRSRASEAIYYVLLSASGRALLFDFGYDLNVGLPAGSDRAARRPWLYSLPALFRDYGVTAITAAVPTHYHDDHVAGLNVLREVYGTPVWAAENFAPILQDPARYDLPCLWYDPIAVDRLLPLEAPVTWEEYTLTLYPLPGHTRHAVAIFLEVDGQRVLLGGDQYQGEDGDLWNYVYQNQFDPGDYVRSAALYARLNPDLILTGHWEPLWVPPGYAARLAESGAALQRLHVELLLPADKALPAEGYGLRLTPYQATVAPAGTLALEVEAHNPLPEAAELTIGLSVPPGWPTPAPPQVVALPAFGAATLAFTLTAPAAPQRRARVAVEVRAGERWLGQAAEALVTVTLPADA